MNTRTASSTETRSRKALWSWILYDVSSSAYILLIGAVAFPIYFKLHVTENAAWNDVIWGALLAISSIVAGIIAPVIGAAADMGGKRLRYLAIATVICCVSTALLALPPVGILPIATMFIVSYIAYLVAAGLYDALLKQVSRESSIGWLSSLGWGLGFVGGLIGYILCKPFLGSDEAPAPQSVFAISFIIIAAYYAIVGGIAIYGMRGLTQKPACATSGNIWRQSISHVLNTMRSWRTSGEIARFIMSTNLISGAASAMGAFTPLILVAYFDLAAHEVALLSAVYLLMSIPATLMMGWLTLHVSAMKILGMLIPLWLLFIILMVFGSGWTAGLFIALLLGLLIGPTNSIVRGLVARVIEEQNAGEMFGFAAMANRFAIAIGPLFFGALSSASGSRALPLFLAGAVILFGIALLPRENFRRML
jgi:UMF1 family MFS transporter